VGEYVAASTFFGLTLMWGWARFLTVVQDGAAPYSPTRAVSAPLGPRLAAGYSVHKTATSERWGVGVQSSGPGDAKMSQLRPEQIA
jgi:hypothetical protein